MNWKQILSFFITPIIASAYQEVSDRVSDPVKKSVLLHYVNLAGEILRVLLDENPADEDQIWQVLESETEGIRREVKNGL